jgi:hypothetical protein
MKKLLAPITTAMTLLLSLSGCGVYPPVDTLPPEPSPTHISVPTLPPTSLRQAQDTAQEGSQDVASFTPEPTAPPDRLDPATPTLPPPPTETTLPEATATLTPEPDWLNYAGRTEDELMFLGNPEAPVTLVDFSDFM